ncbi:helicase-exonuclease AddAB subunit AddA [Aquibacillus koreensis]|uniref:ATP-dependent helicase/nuclease subunit A n=1 Tax=Aquibacillus koreensis TaxID=279446 RepID=A0A9X3WKS2_9BACI|nr:helicase-exonuclease AddAB subunit AddA [Aquibacillus koreensis]MCT2535604.1 helicase-exonuclease AddAB subunit AddA [Aquibacillus koreensis]MDC3420111.1 helicase-exonuclease AddAB subunit AddA [Aquibacillus koreensis]
MPTWTKEQEQAIYTSGTDILVAAAAGSGKTAVLVERIIQKLLNKQQPVDIDSLLVVTFTNAAAQEMRNRVGEALEAALKANPSSNHLKKQLSLLQRASISTLHSFCMDLVRRYAYLLDLDPGFRIADDVEADMIRQEVLEDLFEEWYGKEGEEQEAFFAVVDRFSSDRSDLDVEELVLTLFDFSMQNPWPDHWLDAMTNMYHVQAEVDETNIPWLSILKREVSSQLEAMRAEAKAAMDLTKENDGPYHYAEAIDADFLMINEAAASIQTSWDHTQATFSQGKFKALSRKKVECDEDKKEKVKALRNSYKKRWNDLASDWFSRKLSSYMADMAALYPTIKQLTVLVKDFKQRYAQLKKEKAIVDFSDLEHYALNILVDEDSTVDEVKASQVALEMQKKFTELLVDEYQDTNLVQETILTLLSDQEGNGNMFMVGDVKQSIYRFRHAEPSLFLDKYKQFAEATHPAKRIDLARNFRSREQVLSATNYIFRQLLNEEVGEMNYEKEAELIYSNPIYDELTLPNTDAELLIIDREAQEEDASVSEDESYQDLEKAQIEARAYARMIKDWIGHGEHPPLQVVDKGSGRQRDIQYRDIVILLRSMTWAPTITEELKQQGIPVYAELSTGYFEAIEIKVMLSLLKVIDNPKQDIPLASVLRSPIVGLDEDDLAKIRLSKKRVSYYDALHSFVLETEDEYKEQQVNQFLEQLRSWRELARQGALSDLIWQIYRETGYYDFVGGIPGGRQRQANLRALYDRARAYESTSFRGLFRFLRFIERMEEKGDDLGAARALSAQEDVVRIMTIHKSKGLEFPVVILGAMDKQFNQQDLRQKYLLHKDLGFGSKYIDPEKRIVYPTLAYHALKKEKQRELWAEEMRVLYVAMTRAKEKLVMVGNVASFEKKQEKWQEVIDHHDWVLPAHYRLEANSYLDWVGPALIRHEQNEVLRPNIEVSVQVPEEIRTDKSSWLVEYKHGSSFANVSNHENKSEMSLKETIQSWKPIESIDENLDDIVNQRLTFVYPHQHASTFRAKQSVTEIKRQREVKDDYSDASLVRPYKAPIAKRPAFMQKEKRISAAEKGTILHTVMQHLPLTKQWKKAEIAEFIEYMVTKEILTSTEAEVVDLLAIERFFQTEIGKRLISSSEVHREVPFSLTINANDVYHAWVEETDERVLIQGVIDCLVPVDDGFLLLDYKTDTINGDLSPALTEQLKNRYKVQLELYAKAVEEIWKMPIREKYLYFFDQALLIEVE